MIIDNFRDCSSTIAAFTKYLLEIGYAQQKVVSIVQSNDINDVIGHYISFLASNKIFIIAGHQYFVIYKLDDNNKQDIIEAITVKNNINVIYYAAIVKAINYLEKPF